MEESDNRGYKQLACAIVLQAIEDYSEDVFNELKFTFKLNHVQSLNSKGPTIKALNEAIRDRILCEQFFRSDWCQLLLELGMGLADYDLTPIVEKAHDKGIRMYEEWKGSLVLWKD